MSLTARIIIAIACFIAAISFALAAAFGVADSDAWKFWIMASVCFITTLCCFRGKHSPITNRIIGALVFFIYVAYLISEICIGRFNEWSRAKPCAINALEGLLTFGLPGLYVMIYGYLPFSFATNPDSYDDEDSELEEI